MFDKNIQLRIIAHEFGIDYKNSNKALQAAFELGQGQRPRRGLLRSLVTLIRGLV